MKIEALLPQNRTKGVCIDTELILTFDKRPQVTAVGLIKVFEYDTDKLVDCINLSVPSGPLKRAKQSLADYLKKPYDYKSRDITNKNTEPGTPSADYEKSNENYQLTIIGGFSDGFHFRPVYVKDNSVHIQLHHNILDHNRKYYVLIDGGAIREFKGISKKDDWVFTTRQPLDSSVKRVIVSKEGPAHFRTIQGAIDAIPDHTDKASAYTVLVKNGDYQEIVYFRNKDYVTIVGESRDGVVIHYANNEVFNPHPKTIKTNEKAGTFPSRRAAFAIDNCTHMVLKNLTLKNDAKGQAEGLLVNGSNNYFKNVHIIGSGDALQTNGSAYYDRCVIDGEGDTILGRGPAYFHRTTINSSNAFMWIRNTKANHGNVFVRCILNGMNDNAVIARLPDNHGQQYPHAECVLIDCELNNIPPVGVAPVSDGALTANFLEYRSRDNSGVPVDTSSRHRIVKQLTLAKDAELIENYKDYKFVLQGDNEFYGELIK